MPIKYAVIPCGSQPKQVVFTKNSKYIIVTLLNGPGFQVTSIGKKRVIKTVRTGGEANKFGFAEVMFIPETDTFLVSQMTTNTIFVYYIDTSGEVKFIRSYNSFGKWPKVMAISPDKRYLAVSNWLSNNVSVLSYPDGGLISKIHSKNPRGLAFSMDGEYLLVASFGNGDILKISTKNWKTINKIHINKGAMRHIALGEHNTFFVSDMFHGRIYEVEIEPFRIRRMFRVYRNPNTITLSPDKKYLFVSCRGPNSKEGYLKRSPLPGKIYIINLNSGRAESIIKGGNQPTGLDVSNDGGFFAFSNFMDDDINIFRLKP